MTNILIPKFLIEFIKSFKILFRLLKKRHPILWEVLFFGENRLVLMPKLEEIHKAYIFGNK